MLPHEIPTEHEPPPPQLTVGVLLELVVVEVEVVVVTGRRASRSATN